MNAMTLRSVVFLPALLLAVSDAVAAEPDISGTWWIASYSSRLVPEKGAIPFTEAGKARYEKNQAGLKNGSVEDYAVSVCAAPGVPRVAISPYPFKIVQTKGQVTLLFEYNHVYRRIVFGLTHIPEDEAVLSYMGDQIGRWEGDTLVIDSVNFNNKTWLDDSGLPHGEKLHVTERLRKTGTAQLEDRITVEDLENFTSPWTARLVFDAHPEVELEDFACGEPHRDVSRLTGKKP